MKAATHFISASARSVARMFGASSAGRIQRNPVRRKVRAAAAYACERLEERRLLSLVINPVFGTEPITHGNGAVLNSPPIYLIFWGHYWDTRGAAAVSLGNATASIVNSPYLNMLTQYGSDGLATYAGSAFYNATDPVSGAFNTTQIDTVVRAAIANNSVPGPNSGPHTALYAVVTAPNVISAVPNAGGFNDNFNGIPEIWESNVPDSSGNPVPRNFTGTLSHEIAESMSSQGLGGFEVGPGPSWTLGGSGNQIGDYEPNTYFFNMPNGAVVQALWSNSFNGTSNVILLDNGTTQNLTLNPNWIGNSFTNTFNLVVNGDQRASANDLISLSKTASGGVSVTLNGENTTFAAGQIANVQINSGGGQDLIIVQDTVVPTTISSNSPLAGPDDTVIVGDGGNTQGIAAPLTILNPSGYDAIDVSDTVDTIGRTVTVGSGSPGHGDVSGIAPATIDFVAADTRSLSVETGNANGPYNTVNVVGTVVPTTIIGHSGGPTDTFNVGSNGSQQGIAANLTLEDSGPNDITVDDSQDSSNRTVTMNNAAAGFGAVTGLGAQISYGYTLANLVLKTGLGANVLNVLATGTLTSIVGNSHSGHANTIDVGNAGQVQSIYQLTLEDPTAIDTINVDDSLDSTPRTVTLENTTVAGDPAPYGAITGLGGGPIVYEYADTFQLNLTLGTAADTVNVLATNASAGVTRLVGGAGNDTFNFSPTAANLNAIAGSVEVVSGSGPASIFAYDNNYSTQATYQLDTAFSVATLLRPGFGGIAYVHVQSISLVAGLAPDSIDVMDTDSGTTTNLNSAGGLDAVNIGNSGSVQGIKGVINIRETPGEGSVAIDDSADSSARTATWQNAAASGFGAVVGLAPGEIDYNYADNDLGLSIKLGGGANIVHVHATGATPTTFTGGVAKSFQMDSGATATVSGITITGGTAGGVNGGLNNHGAMTVTDSAIRGNSSSFNGGGILNSGALTLTRCTISGNTATDDGGGIANMHGGTLIINDSAILANVSHGNGGGIDNQGTLTVTNSTFAANSAGGGGALFNINDASATLNNSIFWGDSGSGGEIGNFGLDGSTVHVQFSDVQGGGWPGAGNLAADPMFVSTTNLQLQSTSPAINAGRNALVSGGTTDLAGNPRIASGIVDMGAYEFQGTIPPATLVLVQGPPASIPVGNTFSIIVDVERNGAIVTGANYNSALTFYKNQALVNIITVAEQNGVATFSNISFSQAGTYSLTATDGNADTPVSSGNFNVTAVNTVTSLVFATQPSNVTAGNAISPAVVVDVMQNGQILSTDQSFVVIAVNGGTYTVQAHNGVATFSNITINTPGTYTLLAGDGNDTQATSNSFSVTAPPATLSLGFVKQPTDTPSGSAISQMTVDVYKTVNGVTSLDTADTSSVTLSVATGPAGSVLNGTTTVPVSGGVATFNNVIPSAQGAYTLLATDSNGSSYAPATSGTFSVTPAGVATLVFTQQPTDFTLGPNVPVPTFKVAVERNGVVQTSDNSQISIRAWGVSYLSYGGTLAVNAVNGVATFSNVFLGTAGRSFLEATDTTNPSDVSADSNSFNVSPGPAFYFSISNSGAIAGSSATVTVDAQDVTRNFTPNYSGQVTLSITDPAGKFVESLTASAQGGIATFNDIVLDKAGIYGLLATGTGAGGSGSAGLVVSAASPSQLAFFQQPGSVAAGYVIHPPAIVAVEDQFGNIVNTDNSQVTLSIATPTGIPLGGVVTVAAQIGLATFGNTSINQIGTYTLLADDGNLTAATSLSFNIVAPVTIDVDASATSGANNGTSWPNAFTSLQSALAVAVPGDTIDVAQGDYSPGADPAATFQLIDGVSLQGGYPTGGAGAANPSAYPTLLDGNGNNYHVVTSIGANSTDVFQGFTITGGNANGNGDSFSGFGGGLFVNGGSLTVTNCTFTANSANSGGGLYVFDAAALTLDAVTFSGNSAGAGGGIEQDSTATLTVNNCTFTGNTASGTGGGIDSAGALSVLNSTLSANSAGNGGGGISSTGNLTLINSTLSGNTAAYGGGIYSGGGLLVTDSTLSGNSAGSGAGGGLYTFGGGTIDGTILAANTGFQGTPDDIDGDIVDGSYNLIGVDNTGSFSNGVANNIVGVTPDQLLLSPLANNGGLTQTMALLPGSPAIGVGSIFSGPDTFPITVDQRGILRPGYAPDIGAYQLVVPLTISANGIVGANIYLENDGAGNLEWWISNAAFTGSPLGSITPNGVAALTDLTDGVQVAGSSGDDLFTVDLSNGNAIPSTGIFIDGVSGLDSLVVLGSTTNDNLALAASGAATGLLTANGNSLTLNNISNVAYTDGGGNNALSVSGPIPLIFNVGNETDTLAIAAGASATVNLGASNGALTIVNDGTLVLNIGSGNPAVRFATALPAAADTHSPAPSGSISGHVYDDLNANGNRNVGDKGLGGRTVYIDANHNGKLDPGELRTTTAADGSYKFSGLAAGHYLVREIVPAGWRSTRTNVYDLALTAGQSRADKDFAQTQLALISGTVFRDKNGNGRQDPGDTALAGFTVYLDANNDGKLDNGESSFITGSDGRFSFIVAAGEYHLRVAAKKGFSKTAPAAGAYAISVSGGQIASGNNFGQR